MTLRRIAPIPFPGLTVPDLGPRPSLEWVKPTDLYVDGTYQRDLSKTSMALIPKMIREFAWDRMKPPIVFGIKIETVLGRGYRLDVANKKKIDDYLIIDAEGAAA